MGPGVGKFDDVVASRLDNTLLVEVANTFALVHIILCHGFGLHAFSPQGIIPLNELAGGKLPDVVLEVERHLRLSFADRLVDCDKGWLDALPGAGAPISLCLFGGGGLVIIVIVSLAFRSDRQWEVLAPDTNAKSRIFLSVF